MYRDKSSNKKIQIGKKLFVWGFVLVVMAAIAVGGAEQSPAEAGPNTSIVAVDAYVSRNEGAGPDLRAGADITPEGKIRLIAFEKDRSIREGLRILAALYKKNIVPSSKVDGLLTVTSLYDVTFEQALDAILGYGFKYEQEGNFVKVYTAEEHKKIKEDPARMVYEVFTLYYITADEAQKLIKPVLSESAVVQASTAAETDISGGGGSSSSGGGGGSAGAGLIGSGGGNSMALYDILVVYDYPENIEKAAELIETLDIRPKQVLVEATILAAVLTEGMELGVDWNLMAGVALDGTASTDDIINTAGQVDRGTAASYPISDIKDGGITKGTPIETFGFATQGGRGLRIGISMGDIRAFITALESVTDTTVLANPKILAVNKQEGSVLIGTNLGYRSSTTISAGGVATEGEVKFLQTGTQLVFRPYIGNDGYIRMDIYPKDSSAALNDDGVPTEQTTQLKTNIIVKDGGTIVIGGLFRDVITSTRKQVPLLGDIPIIGGLFRGTSDNVRREEVIVLLTTHIIEEPEETEGQARADDIRRKRFGAKDELQEIGRARLAEDRYAKAAKYYIEGNNEFAMRELSVALALRPAYLEAIRLKERIIEETSPDDVEKIERIMLEAVDQKEVRKWLRR